MKRIRIKLPAAMLPPRIEIYSYVAMCPPPAATLLFVVSISPPRRRMSALSSSGVIHFNPLATTVHVCLHSTDSLIPSPPATPPAVVGSLPFTKPPSHRPRFNVHSSTAVPCATSSRACHRQRPISTTVTWSLQRLPYLHIKTPCVSSFQSDCQRPFPQSISSATHHHPPPMICASRQP